MAQFTLPLLLLISLLALASTASSAKRKASAPSIFVKSSCNTTLYPSLCVESLSIFSTKIRTNPKLIAQIALLVSLSQARSANTYVRMKSKSKGMKKREYQAMVDCVETMGDSVDRLGVSIGELRNTGKGRGEFLWHMSNVETWVSAALTDEDTCIDEFDGRAMDGKLKIAIRGRITRVARLTSVALALINRYAERHQ